MASEIVFTAAVAKIQTMVDGGIRVTLDLPEGAIMQMAALAECHRAGAMLEVTAVPVLHSRGNRGSRSNG